MPTIDTIMTTRLVCVEPDASVGRMYNIFQKFHIHHVLILDKGRLAGIVNDRDILRRISPFIGSPQETPRDRNTLDATAQQLMDPSPPVIAANTGIRDAGRAFLDNKVSLLPVVDDHQIVIGVLSWKDVMRYIID